MGMRRSLFLLALALVSCLAASSLAQDADTPPRPSATSAAAGSPCTSSGGAAIYLSNHGFCYLVGRRMRRGSIFAQCKDGVLTCFADEGIPDKSNKEVDCVAPEPGNCKSSATPAATNATTSSAAESRSSNLDGLNPSAVVAGNLDVPGLDE
ncbi:hypothetical protein FI667_g5455, partial [Globisporangium splendens]